VCEDIFGVPTKAHHSTAGAQIFFSSSITPPKVERKWWLECRW